MKKRFILLSFALLALGQSFGCPVCDRNQPKLLRGLVHGSGPDSNWDYFIVIIMVLVALVTLFYSIKWLIKPGENKQDHIKRMILKSEEYE